MASTMTWGELLSQARYLLQDTDDSRYRFPDDKLLTACHFACLTMKQVRPDLAFGRYLPTGEASICFPAPPYTEADITTIKTEAAPFPEIYIQPVVLFVAGFSEIINEEFTGSDRAASMLSSFKSQLMKATL